MDLSLRDRLMAIINHYHTTIASFERDCGMCNAYVRNVKDSIGSKTVKGILSAYPNINPLWLLTGDGPMLNENVNSNEQSLSSNEFSGFSKKNIYDLNRSLLILKEELDKKNEQVDRLINLLERIVYQNSNSDLSDMKISPKSRQKK